MKKALPILWGSILFPIGFIVNAFMMAGSVPVAVYLALSMATLLLWFWGGTVCYGLTDNLWMALILGNLVPLIDLMLVLLQEIVLGGYWQNLFGFATQLFYLPMLSLSFSLTSMFSRLAPAYIVAFLLMLLAFFLGAFMAKKRRN